MMNWLFFIGLLAASGLALPQQPIRSNPILFRTLSAIDTCASIPSWMMKTKIVGGEPAETPIPWQVSIRSCKTGDCHYCGGTILDEKTVLTAAHCYEYLNTMEGHYVMAGSLDRFDTSAQVIAIDTIVRNEALPYVSKEINNDYLILKMKSSFTFDAHVQRACLPDASDTPKAGEMCFVSGWGKNKYGTETEVLQFVGLPVVSHDVCSENYTGINRITDSMMCAGYEAGGKDACQADSGGPLICNIGGKATLTGIVSFGVGCGTPGYPGVYAKVSKVRPWIDEETGVGPSCPSKISAWWGDKYCDDIMNTEECGYDGGDCCQDSPHRSWDSYCTVYIFLYKKHVSQTNVSLY